MIQDASDPSTGYGAPSPVVGAAGTGAPCGSGRVQAFDAARGGAMGFVCLAHMLEPVVFTSGPTQARTILLAVSTVASPTFMLISGMVLGTAASRTPAELGRLGDKLRERGLFPLVIGHLLMLPAHIPMPTIRRRSGTSA